MTTPTRQQATAAMAILYAYTVAQRVDMGLAEDAPLKVVFDSKIMGIPNENAMYSAVVERQPL